MKQILIEFFSQRTPENLVSLLNERFDNVIFLHFENEEAPDKNLVKLMKNIVNDVLGCYPLFMPVKERSVESTLETLTVLSRSRERLVFDITGGNEIFIAAAGIFMAQNPALPTRLQQYNIRTGELVTVYPKNEALSSRPLHKHLTAKQVFTLNGTGFADSGKGEGTSLREAPPAAEVYRLWNAVKGHLKEWNNFFSFSSEKDKNSITQKKMPSDPGRIRDYRVIAQCLKAAGIMKNERTIQKGHHTYMEFDLNVPEEALTLYKKGGNLLEFYVALAADAAGIFHEIRVGVELDWDGKDSPEEQEPCNEIDVVLLKENLPILVSCKNCPPDKEHLYEIMIMTNHYGGFYGTPALFSSFQTNKTVSMRAKEMGIRLIDNIGEKDFLEFSREIRRTFS